MQHFSHEDFSISWQIHIPQTHFSKVNSSSSSFLPTLLKRKALPVAPVKRVEMSSERLVRIVSQFAQENRRVPPIWSKKILPIFRTYVSLYSRPESKKKHHVKKNYRKKLKPPNIPYIWQNILQTNSANDCSKSLLCWWITELSLPSPSHQDKFLLKVIILPIRWFKYKLITWNEKNTNWNL